MGQTGTTGEVSLAQMNVPWFASPFFHTLLEEAQLSPADHALVQAFARDGYLIIDPQLPDFPQMAEGITQRLAAPLAAHGRVQDAWKTDADVQRLATLPEVDRILRLLYQRDPIPFQTLNFPRGTQQATHSDTVHFHSVPHGFMCAAWIPFEPIDAGNGPLHIYPGSHALPAWDLHALGLPSGVESYHRYESCMQAYVEALGLTKKVLALEPGQVVIWAANLLHGGEPILDPARTRHSQVTHYYFSDCLYYTPMLSDPYIGKVHLRAITDIRTGKPVENRYGGKPVSIVQTVPPADAFKRVLRKIRKRFSV